MLVAEFDRRSILIILSQQPLLVPSHGRKRIKFLNLYGGMNHG